jgi:peptidoglycan-associated lipoprotein
MKFLIKSALVLIPALVLLGCGTSGDVQEQGAAGTGGQATASTAPTTGAAGAGGAAGGAAGETVTNGTGAGAAGAAGTAGGEAPQRLDAVGGMGAGQAGSLDDPNSLLAKRVIYFDFDQSDIKSEFQAVLQAHAAYLAKNPSASITLEGHCDERGTREYNIALGERRANAVQRVLTLQGAAAGQVRVVSYGEERPASPGQTEEAWALNRRAEIIYNNR